MANVIRGGTNTVWGTPNFGIQGTNGNYPILDSIDISDPNGKPIFVEGRNGTDAIAVMLDNGFDCEMTAIYSTSVTLPAKGENVVIKLANSAGNNVNCTVSSCSIQSQKKQLTTVKISAFYRPDIA